MKLTLDHTQRLNLHALLGAQRADVGSIRAIWAVQDKLALDADEERALELTHDVLNGQERTLWNRLLRIPAKETEFTDLEIVRIKAAIENWEHYVASGDRCWLKPLVDALFSQYLSGPTPPLNRPGAQIPGQSSPPPSCI